MKIQSSTFEFESEYCDLITLDIGMGIDFNTCTGHSSGIEEIFPFHVQGQRI